MHYDDAYFFCIVGTQSPYRTKQHYGKGEAYGCGDFSHGEILPWEMKNEKSGEGGVAKEEGLARGFNAVTSTVFRQAR